MRTLKPTHTPVWPDRLWNTARFYGILTIWKIETVQRRAACYTTNRFGNTSSISSVLQHLQWESLESRRAKTLVNDHQQMSISSTKTTRAHSKKYRHFFSSTDSFKFSPPPSTSPVQTLTLWNSLPAYVAEAPSLVSSRNRLTRRSF